MFIAYQVALELIRALRPIIAVVRKFDRGLANQMQEASNSIALNLAEGSYRAGGDRRHSFEIAAGSTNEVGAGLDITAAWEWPVDTTEARAILDRLRALVWGLTRGSARA